MEEEIKEVFSDATITKQEGDKGIFDITLNGKLIFSKLQKEGTCTIGFPEPGEIITLIKKEL